MADDWHERYDKARDALTAAITEQQHADGILARATAKRNDAERAVGLLYREREQVLNARYQQKRQTG